jgi:hypothetical protein
MTALVSVIAAVRNPEEYAEVEAVLAAQAYPNLELVAPELGRDFDALWDDGSVGAPAFHAGTYLAHGDYFAYWLPGDRWSAGHVAKLIDLLEVSKAHFAYSKMRYGEEILGTDPPRFGEVESSCIVHRANLILAENWRDGGPSFAWDLVTRWVGINAHWAFLDAVTVERDAPVPLPDISELSA